MPSKHISKISDYLSPPLELGIDNAGCSAPSPAPKAPRASAFNEIGFKATIDLLCEEIRELYTADDVPWIIGYSGERIPRPPCN
jgi:DNA sulfur modification protein DndC